MLAALSALLLAAPLLGAAQAQPPTASPQDLAFFEARVRPLLLQRCAACHSQKVAQGGLRLDDPQALRRGGDAGPVLVPGKPGESRLIHAVRYGDPKLQMPPSGKLPEAEIQVLEQWIQRGAALPAPTGVPTGKAGPMSIAEGRKLWSIRPFLRVEPRPPKRKGWVRKRIDGYLLAAMEAKGLAPTPEADRRTLIRRASLDLTGLPPSPEEIEAFVGDPAPDPYPALVDRLLASQHYGERWGRHWLDLVRYCDVPESWAVVDAQAWRYRDWVVEALNRDLPYHRFVQLQLAADEMPDAPPADLAALGFLGLSPTYWKELKLAPDVIKTVVAEEWEERITTLSGTLLGLTAACARCHDHKFDPITTKDYYALAGVLASTRQTARPLLAEEEARQVMAARERLAALQAEEKKLAEQMQKEPASAAELKQSAEAVRARMAELRTATPHLDAPTVYAVETAALEVLPDGETRTKIDYRMGAAQDVPMQLRGNPARPGETVPRGYLEVLSPGEPVRFTQGSGRRELGEAIFHSSAPLAARVIVNRVWKGHFGKGLVETPSNFGVQGDRPTHPELLDDLARRFVEAGWSLKWLHREILLSAAFRQSSRPAAAALKSDPDNRLLSHMNRMRLEVEPWRDSILAATGQLDLRIGGASAPLGNPANVRRTLYGTVTRRDLDDLLRLYDFPDPTAHSPARFHTTTPLQQLYVLNSPFIAQQATALVKRVQSEAPDLAGQVRRAHLLLYGRPPTDEEARAAAGFLGATPTPEAWQQLAEVLLARNDLMFVE